MIYGASLSTKNEREMSVFWFRPNILLIQIMVLWWASYYWWLLLSASLYLLSRPRSKSQVQCQMRVFRTVGWRHENNKPCVYLRVNFTVLQMFSVIKLPSLWLNIVTLNITEHCGGKHSSKYKVQMERYFCFKSCIFRFLTLRTVSHSRPKMTAWWRLLLWG